METKKLSDYMDKMFNAVYLHPKRTADTIDENIKDDKSDLFGAIFPLPNHYTYEAGENGIKVQQYDTRQAAADARKNSSKAESHRDYLILDVARFEEWLTDAADEVKRRMPKGMRATTTATGYYDIETLMSLTTEEARREYAAKIAAKVGKKKRTMSDEQREAARERMSKMHKDGTMSKGTKKSTKSK